MDVLLFIAVLIAAYYIPKLYEWVKFKNKYPILSEEPPSGILSPGDVVYFGKDKYEYLGVSRTDGLWYVFIPDDSISSCHIDQKDAISRIDAIYGRYGLKWKRVK